MFELGTLELLVIGVTALIVVGPKDLPGMFRAVGRFVGKARGMAREFQRAMNDAADESGIKDATRDLADLDNLRFDKPGQKARDYAKGFMSDDPDTKAKGDPPAHPAKDGPKDGTA